MKHSQILAMAEQILAKNDQGTWTQPAVDMYPNQWFWDSCFIAIGQAHINPKRAIRELRSLTAGQWENGMIPHQIFHKGENDYRNGSRVWQSSVSSLSPPTVATSGITQPPLLAEAIFRIGKQLSKTEKTKLYKEFYPKILAYHNWLYTERDPHREGLVILVHPWENGMDNTPPWMEELRFHHTPLWIKTIGKLKIDKLIERLRQDTQTAGVHERISTLDALRLYDVVRRMRRKKYQTNQILRHSLFTVEDVFFNSILIRNNQILLDIAKQLNEKIPNELRVQFAKAPIALESLWNEASGEYYSRNFVTTEPMKVSTIATFMPLYSRSINKERASQLVKLLSDPKAYNLKFTVPSVSKKSKYFKDHHYWSGPIWINTNWLIVDGLRHYGFTHEAKKITQSTFELIEKSGFREYFSPLDGHGIGATDFSWTAALVIDFIKNHES